MIIVVKTRFWIYPGDTTRKTKWSVCLTVWMQLSSMYVPVKFYFDKTRFRTLSFWAIGLLSIIYLHDDNNTETYVPCADVVPMNNISTAENTAVTIDVIIVERSFGKCTEFRKFMLNGNRTSECVDHEYFPRFRWWIQPFILWRLFRHRCRTNGGHRMRFYVVIAVVIEHIVRMRQWPYSERRLDHDKIIYCVDNLCVCKQSEKLTWRREFTRANEKYWKKIWAFDFWQSIYIYENYWL